MKEGRKKERTNTEEVFQASYIEVTAESCGGDLNKMIKRFDRKVRKEELLKPFYGRLMFHTTKSQKERSKKLRGIYKHRKNEEKNQIEE